MNENLLNVSQWLSDYYLLVTVLIAGVLITGKLVRQPARRIAMSWSAAMGLLGLGLLCAVPGWSWVHMTGLPPAPPVRTTPPQPLVGPAVQVAQLAPLPLVPETGTTDRPTTVGAPVPIKRIAVDYRAITLCVILGGGTVLSVWLVLGVWQVHRLRSHAAPAPRELIATAEKITPVGCRVPLLGVVDPLQVAAAVGLWRPMVLLPQSMIDGASSVELKSVLAHELAHLRHRDLWLLALLRGLLLVLWAHPLYWWWRRRVRLDQETLADAAAAEVTSRTDYAEQLVAWARVASGTVIPRFASSVGLWESPSQLRRRVAVLLDERMTVLRTCSRQWRVGSALSLWTVAIGLSWLTLTPSNVLLAEAKPEEETETKPAQDVGTITGTFRVSSLVAEAERSDQHVAETESKAGTVALSDKEKVKLMQPHTRRLHDAKKPNTILGICIDERSQPLPDVLVEVFSRRIDGSETITKPILMTKSDQRGEFRFENVVNIEQEFPEGIPAEDFQPSNAKVLTFIGQKDGRVPGIGSNMLASLAQHGGFWVWVMQPAETLHGRVTDQQGKPVAGARVTSGWAASTSGGGHGINSAMTSADGQYVISDLAASDNEPWASLVVKHPNFAAQRATIKQIPGKVDVQLLPGSVIEGKVAFPEGDATTRIPAGSVVRLQRVLSQPKLGGQLSHYGFQMETTLLDGAGRYRFASLPAGKYHFTAYVEGWFTQGVENVEVAQGDTATAPNILLTHGGRVRVQLVDDKTGQSMRFEKPTKGYINPDQRPRRAPIFSSLNNHRVEFSTDGIGEIQLPVGSYVFHVSILTEGGDLISGVYADYAQWPTYEVEEDKRLNISARMRVHQRPLANGGTWTLIPAATPVGGESTEDVGIHLRYEPETLPAEESTSDE